LQERRFLRDGIFEIRAEIRAPAGSGKSNDLTGLIISTAALLA
jgi:hypothetical protein